jgi:hypothetical protein
VLRAEAEATAAATRARGQAEAISTVFKAIHEGNPDQGLLAYQYLQMLPQLAKGDANKIWIVPSEMGKALEGLGGFFSAVNNGRDEASQAAAANDPVEPPVGLKPVSGDLAAKMRTDPQR